MTVCIPWCSFALSEWQETYTLKIENHLPRVQTKIGQRSFAFCSPTVWNSLSSAMCDINLSMIVFSWPLMAYILQTALNTVNDSVTRWICVLTHWIFTYLVSNVHHIKPEIGKFGSILEPTPVSHRQSDWRWLRPSCWAQLHGRHSTVK